MTTVIRHLMSVQIKRGESSSQLHIIQTNMVQCHSSECACCDIQ